MNAPPVGALRRDKWCVPPRREEGRRGAANTAHGHESFHDWRAHTRMVEPGKRSGSTEDPMTRKHFMALAWSLRQQHPRVIGAYAPDSDVFFGATLYWERCVLAVAAACAQFNGSFDRERFLLAVGYTIRPDGSPFPMAAPR